MEQGKRSGCYVTMYLTNTRRGEDFFVKRECMRHSSLFLLHKHEGIKCEKCGKDVFRNMGLATVLKALK